MRSTRSSGWAIREQCGWLQRDSILYADAQRAEAARARPWKGWQAITWPSIWHAATAAQAPYPQDRAAERGQRRGQRVEQSEQRVEQAAGKLGVAIGHGPRAQACCECRRLVVVRCFTCSTIIIALCQWMCVWVVCTRTIDDDASGRDRTGWTAKAWLVHVVPLPAVLARGGAQ